MRSSAGCQLKTAPQICAAQNSAERIEDTGRICGSCAQPVAHRRAFCGRCAAQRGAGGRTKCQDQSVQINLAVVFPIAVFFFAGGGAAAATLQLMAYVKGAAQLAPSE